MSTPFLLLFVLAAAVAPAPEARDLAPQAAPVLRLEIGPPPGPGALPMVHLATDPDAPGRLIRTTRYHGPGASTRTLHVEYLETRDDPRRADKPESLETTVQDPEHPDEPWVVTTWKRKHESLELFIIRHGAMVEAVRRYLSGDR